MVPLKRLICLSTCTLALAASAEAPAADAPTQPDPSAWTATWRPKLEVRRNDGMFDLRMGGRLLLDGALLYYSPGLTRAPRVGWDAEAVVRQARIFVKGQAWRRIEVKAEVDFSGDDFDPKDYTLTDAYLGIRDLPVLGTVRAGHQKNPFSFENAMSRKYMVFMERSLIERLAPSGRDLGVTARDTAFDRRMQWEFGGFRSTGSNGHDLTVPSSYLLTGRVSGLPWTTDEDRQLVHLGGSYSHQFAPNGTGSISQRPESFLATALVSTKTIPVDYLDRAGFEAVSVHGPLSFQSELTYDWIKRSTDGTTLQFWGWYAMVSWFVTGEHRAYDRKLGFFGPVVPRKPFAPRKGHWGAFQLGARYSYVDLNDDNVRGGIESDLAFAANWFLLWNLRLSTNYVFAHVNGQGYAHILQGRIQLEY